MTGKLGSLNIVWFFSSFFTMHDPSAVVFDFSDIFVGILQLQSESVFENCRFYKLDLRESFRSGVVFS